MRATSTWLFASAAACAQPGRTVGVAAVQLRVSVSFVVKLLQRQSCPIAAVRHRDMTRLRGHKIGSCVRQQSDATLDWLGIWLAAVGGPGVSRATPGRR